MFAFPFSRELKNKKIKKRFKEDIEPQEILLDYLAKKKEEELGIEEKKLEIPLSISRGFLIFIFILISFLFFKTFQLQIVEGKKFSKLAEKNKFKIYQIQAERGVIYDRNYNQLVYNSPSFDLFLDTKNLPKSEEEKLKILKEVSLILKKDIEELKRKIEDSSNTQTEILIQENLDYLSLILLETKIDSAELPGFQIKKNFVRVYKTEPNFSHLIGYTGKISAEELKAEPEQYTIFDWVGKSGLEKSYEKVLRRNPGKVRQERDALGNLISEEIIQLPEPGKSLVLWLDSELQGKIREELSKQLVQLGAEKGVAVALDPKTGGILSLVSLPDFDNNLFQQGSDEKTIRALLEDPKKPLFNRVISGQYVVGSTIKPLIASAALQENLISPQKKINCQGRIQVKHRYRPEIIYHYHDWQTHGPTDMRKAIAESCNVYFYIVGGGYKEQAGLGPTRIKKYLEKFGWGEKTQIDLPEEKKGFIPSPEWKKETKKENWYDGDTYHLSIGQGDILITPLQVVTSFAAIANGGKLLKPKIVQKIVDDKKNLVQEFGPEIIRENFIDPANLQVVREGMAGAALYGTAAPLSNLPVKAAAKTGTAQTQRKGYFHNWITVFAPYQDPEIVLTIMIEDVKGTLGGVTPVAQKILEWYFTREK